MVLSAVLCVTAIVAIVVLRRTADVTPAGRIVKDLVTNEGEIRRALLEELQPVSLANCDLRRYGEPHDGGYLLCENLLESVTAGYSYGISGYDGWGCDVSRGLDVRVHQYDCFNTQRPACPGGDTLFHEECVAGERSVDDGRLFDSIQNQTVANGDAEGHIVLKIDVEGAEWDSFLRTPDALLERIDQIAVEFHGVGEDRFVDTVRHLKRFFFVASLHFNNYSCSADIQPFPAWAYEVLFVNKRLGVLDPSPAAVRMSPLHALNGPDLEDCQAPRP